ncbi:MAG TPA: hypothetical protein ENJ11_02440 [Gammaproteobacteria bacterium]|nr:hypothetical protein [Gammaproteobacteria bacterium]
MKKTFSQSGQCFLRGMMALCVSFGLALGMSPDSHAAETACNNNGGAGWPISDGSITNIPIAFQFADVATAFDVNVSTDITHTWIGDLTVKVTSPQGTTVQMFERPGTNAGDTAPTDSGPYGCGQNDINVTFDDEAASGITIENECPPVAGGSYLSDDPTPLDLSAFDGENPTGNWNFYISDSATQDTGTLNQACITASFAGVNFDKWVSTNNSCSDKLDTLTVTSGTDVYYCYTVSNPSTEAFTINPGAAIDDQGHDLSPLETGYPPGATQTVVIGPITAGGAALPENITTVNNAQVTASFNTANYTGSLVTSESASLSVILNPPAPPANGSKQLYLADLQDTSAPAGIRDLTRTVPAVDSVTGNINGNGGFQEYDMTPVFQKPFSINGGSTVNVFLSLERRSRGGARTVQVDLYNGGTGALLGTDTFNWNAAGIQTNTFSFPIAADTGFNPGDYVRIRITNTTNRNNRRIRVHQIAATPSQVQINTPTVINIDNLQVFSAAYNGTGQLSSYTPGSTVYIRATVSDPFGNADINGASITITDSLSTVQVNNAAMTQVATLDGATLVYEYAYTLPATPDGRWNVSVTAMEGTEGTISHTAQTTMVVGAPALNVSKSSLVLSDPVNATNPKAIPGAIVEYSIDISNTGFGYVDIDSLVVADPVATGSTFYFGSPANPVSFIDGATSSGLSFTFSSLGSTTDDVDFSNDGGATFITPTTDANGYDTTVPPVNFIRITPRGSFRGSDGINHPSISLKFRVRIN